MLNTTDAFKSAIVEVPRKTRVKIPARIADADMERALGTTSAAAPVSHGGEVVDGNLHMSDHYVTLERNRWVLNGTGKILPDDYAWDGQTGFVSEARSDEEGYIAAVNVHVSVSGVEMLRAVSIYFSDNEADGTAEEFTVFVYTESSGTYRLQYKETVTGNTEPWYLVRGVLVANPARIRVAITKWSLPFRRARVLELYPGYAIDWTESDVTALSVKQQTSLTAMQQPYGTASVTLDNTNWLFNPIDKTGMLQSLEEGQGFPVELGVDLADGGAEYVPLGVFYHHNRGWAMSDSGMTMRFNFVDIIGLLADVSFTDPETLPTTLAGWLSALVAHLGPRFEGHYALDPEDIADYALELETETAEEGEEPPKSAMHGKACTEVLRLICQATGCIAMTRPSDGYLLLRMLLRKSNPKGPDYTLDNLSEIPVYSANDYLSSITFKDIRTGETDEEGNPVTEDEVFRGEEAAPSTTASVSNPFVTTFNAALAVSQRIFSGYGGNKISVTGRGDPSAELGDFVSTENRDGSRALGRITQQTFQLSGSVLQGCKTEMLHVTTTYNTYEHRIVFTENGSWTVPEGVHEVYAVLVGGGDGGEAGPGDGLTTFPKPSYAMEAFLAGKFDGGSYGEREFLNPGWVAGTSRTAYFGGYYEYGKDGSGGKIYATEASVNPGQTYWITVGKGGAGGWASYLSWTDERKETYIQRRADNLYDALIEKGYPEAYVSHEVDNYLHRDARTEWAHYKWYVEMHGPEEGAATTFAGYSSSSGAVYNDRYIDVYGGGVYGLPGCKTPAPNTGNGGAGGVGVGLAIGASRKRYADWWDSPPTYEGTARRGTDGSSGVCVIYYNDPEEDEA